MLFVDNPVGTGFSYSDRPDGYATNVATVASDMLVLLGHFFAEKAEFQVCRVSQHQKARKCGKAVYFTILANASKPQHFSKISSRGLSFPAGFLMPFKVRTKNISVNGGQAKKNKSSKVFMFFIYTTDLFVNAK